MRASPGLYSGGGRAKGLSVRPNQSKKRAALNVGMTAEAVIWLDDGFRKTK